MKREVHHITVVVGDNPHHGEPRSYGSGKFLARACFGTSETGPDFEIAAAGSKSNATANAVKALMRQAAYFGGTGQAPKERR